MMVFRSLTLTLFVAYALGVLTTRWLVLHTIAVDPPAVAAMVAVPALQAVVLTGWRRIFAARRRR